MLGAQTSARTVLQLWLTGSRQRLPPCTVQATELKSSDRSDVALLFPLPNRLAGTVGRGHGGDLPSFNGQPFRDLLLFNFLFLESVTNTSAGHPIDFTTQRDLCLY